MFRMRRQACRDAGCTHWLAKNSAQAADSSVEVRAGSSAAIDAAATISQRRAEDCVNMVRFGQPAILRGEQFTCVSSRNRIGPVLDDKCGESLI